MIKAKVHDWLPGSIPQRMASDPLLIQKSLSLLGLQHEELTKRSKEITGLLQQREDVSLSLFLKFRNVSV